jgi:hypothetical protein
MIRLAAAAVTVLDNTGSLDHIGNSILRGLDISADAGKRTASLIGEETNERRINDSLERRRTGVELQTLLNGLLVDWLIN